MPPRAENRDGVVMSSFIVGLSVFVGLAIALLGASVHKIEEGKVGVYFRGGALLSETTPPGYHLKMPILTTVHSLQTTLQTDAVFDIPCGTAGGVMIYFERVEVVNRLKTQYVIDTVRNYSVNYDQILMFDKIHHELNQFCSVHTLEEVYIEKFAEVDNRLADALQQSCNQWAPGVEIVSVRVTKPKLPESIRRNYELIESERTKLKISQGQQQVAINEAETEKKRATIEATKVAEVSKIKVEQKILEMEGAKKIASIENDIYLEKQRALSDAEAYKMEKAAEANKKLLTKEFLEKIRLEAISNNTKIFFGPDIPSMMVGPGAAIGQ